MSESGVERILQRIGSLEGRVAVLERRLMGAAGWAGVAYVVAKMLEHLL